MTNATAGQLIRALAAAVLLATGLVCVTQPVAAGAGREAAREELRLRARAEQRMREDFESLLANGRMSAQEIADFEIYLAQLARLVEEQRRLVAELEGGGGAGAPGPARAPALPGDFDRGQTDEEKIAMLDAQLGSSLSEFDEKLLREQNEIAQKSRSTTSGDDDSQSGEGASGQSRQSDGSGDQEGEGEAGAEQAGSSGDPPSGESAAGGESAEQAGGKEPDGARGESGEGNDQVASAGGESSAGGQTGRTSTPPDIPDGKDDDIVARQLREAAENEQDPELREKLWEEYRRYKKSTR